MSTNWTNIVIIVGLLVIALSGVAAAVYQPANYQAYLGLTSSVLTGIFGWWQGNKSNGNGGTKP